MKNVFLKRFKGRNGRILAEKYCQRLNMKIEELFSLITKYCKNKGVNPYLRDSIVPALMININDSREDFYEIKKPYVKVEDSNRILMRKHYDIVYYSEPQYSFYLYCPKINLHQVWNISDMKIIHCDNETILYEFRNQDIFRKIRRCKMNKKKRAIEHRICECCGNDYEVDETKSHFCEKCRMWW